MATTVVTKPPVLETLTRRPDGALHFSWTNQADTATVYTAIQVFARVVGGGTWVQVNTLGYPAISNQQYVQYAAPGGGVFKPGVAYELTLRAVSSKGGTSAYASARSVPALKTPTPTFTSATRVSASTVSIVLAQNPEPPATIDAVYVYRRLVGTGAWTQVNRTVSPSQTTISVSGLDGAKAYEFVLRSSGPAGWSDYSTIRSAGVWWELPPGVTNLQGERAATGAATLTWSGAGTATGPWQSIRIYRGSGVNQPTLIATLSGSARTYTDSRAAAGTSYTYVVVPVSPAGESTSRASTTLAATVQAPTPPSNIAAVYVADNKATVTWTSTATGDKPWSTLKLLYRPVGASTWSPVSVSVTGTSHTVSLAANTRFEFSMQSANAAGLSEIPAPVGPISTVPAAPSQIDATWTGADISLKLPPVSTIADRFAVEFSTDNTVWYPAATLATSTTSWVHSAPSKTVIHRYRVRAEIADGSSSAWVYSPIVPAQTQPHPPIVEPSGTIDATLPIPIRVVHDPRDGSPQTAGAVEYSSDEPPAQTWATLNLGASDTATIPANVVPQGGTIYVRAWTAGASGEPSPYSTIQIVTRPPIRFVIHEPQSVVTSQEITVAWQPESAAFAYVEIVDAAGRIVDSAIASETEQSVSGLGPLEHGETYVARVTLHDFIQPSVQEVAFTVQLVTPPPHHLLAERTTNEAVILTSDAVGAERGDIYRSLDGGATWALVGPIDQDWTSTDQFAPLSEVTYRLRAYHAAGGWIDSPPVAVKPGREACSFWLHWGDNLEHSAHAGWNPANVINAGRQVVLNRFVGDDDPTPIFGAKQPYVVKVSFLVDPLDGDTPLATWEQIAEWAGVVVWRDPAGRVIRAVCSDWVLDDSDILNQTVGFTLTRVAA